MSSYQVRMCHSCRSQFLKPVLHLGWSSPSCSMTGTPAGAHEVYPLELVRCQDCTLIQLSCVVKPELVFHKSYPYSSANNPELHENFDQFAAVVSERLEPGDVVVDIGANDGTLLSKFGDSVTKVGVEPTDQIHNAAVDLAIYQEFFDMASAARIVADRGQARLVTACNVMAHMDRVHSVLKGIKHLLARDGVFVAENHDLASVVEGKQWDTVYHEHLRYFTPYSFAKMLQLYGLHVIRTESIPTHGGSFRAWAVHADRPALLDLNDPGYDYAMLARSAAQTRSYLRSIIGVERRSGRKVGAVGATARASTVIGYCGLNEDDICAVYERSSSDKLGLFMAGTAIPVVDEAQLFGEDAPDTLVLFSWHLRQHIIPKLRSKGFQGVIILPLPEVELRHANGDSEFVQRRWNT